MNKLIPVIAFILTTSPIFACSFCGGNPAGRATLREECLTADAVLFGTMKNPQLGSDPTTGTTEFHVRAILKSHGVIEKRAMIVIPKYIPQRAGDSGESVVFILDRKGVPDAVRIHSSNAALAEYLAGISKLDPKDVPARLEFAFKHLDAADEAVAVDAFLEFAKAGDADVLNAKAKFDPAKLRTLLKNPKATGGQFGVYALLLGLCGDKTDAAFLAGMVEGRLNERTMSALGGILSGLVLLDADAGWKDIARFLGGIQYSYVVRLNTFSAVRYLQTTRPKESREPILAVYRELLDDKDIADLAIEDLRRWKWWDHTGPILKMYGQPEFKAKALRNAILRYALTCPDSAAKEFVAAVRKQDPVLVSDIEERIKSLE